MSHKVKMGRRVDETFEQTFKALTPIQRDAVNWWDGAALVLL